VPQAEPRTVGDLRGGLRAGGVDDPAERFERDRDAADLLVGEEIEGPARDAGELLAHRVERRSDVLHADTVTPATDIRNSPDERRNYR
jgi:hypothetical protein